MTIAELGIAVQSGDAKAATGDLRGLAAAAKEAEQAANKLTQATQKSGPALSTVESMARRAGVSVEEMQRRVDAASAGQQKLAAASATAVKGIQQLSQQATKASNDNKALADQTDKTTGSLEKFALRFTRGLIAGAAIATVQQLTRYLFDLNSQIAATGDTARRVGIGGQQFQGLQTTAAYKGIGNSDFNAAMIAFNQQVDLAKNGLGDLQALLRLNGKTVSDTVTTFGIVADLVKNAGSEAQKFSILQSAGLPANREFVKLMEQGADKIRIQSQFSKGLTDQQLSDAQKVNDQWQKAWTDFENWGKRSVVNVATAITRAAPGFVSGLTGVSLDTINRGKGIGLLKEGQGTPLSGQRDDLLKNIYNATGAFGTEQTAESAAKSLELERQKTAQAQQRLGLLGPLLNAEEARKQVELQIAAAGQNLIFIDDTRAKKLAQIAYETNLGITAIKANTDALNVEAQTIGMSTGQAAAYSAAQSILNEKKRLGISVSDEQRAAIIREAEAMGRAKDSVEQLRFAHDTFVSGFVDFGQQIRNGASAWDAFRSAGTNALGKIADKLMSMAADQLWTSAFGGAGSGSTGLLGGLFSGIGKLFAAADGGTFGPGWGVVGERGPELIRVNQGSVTVVPNHVSKPYLPGFAEGGMLSASGNVTRLPFGQNNEPQTVINYAPQIDARGADAAAVARLEIAMARQQRDFEKNVLGVQAKHRANTPGSNR